MNQQAAHAAGQLLTLTSAAPGQPQMGSASPAARELDSRALLAGKACIAIRHGADVYWLRSTRQGKLLLTK